MSEGLADPGLADAPDAAARQWLEQLALSPEQALDSLLRGAVWLGAYASLDAPQALAQFVPERLVETLDHALCQWLAHRQQQSALPTAHSAKSFAKSLTEAFGLMQTLSLPLSQAWCRQNANALWHWLATQPSFAAREPRASFLRSLALLQPNRDLIDFWLQLCRQAHPRWVPLALFGLRRMPIDDQGTPAPGLPMALVSGLIDYGLALVRRGPHAHKKIWLAELDLLTAVYPMSRPQWAERFRIALALRQGDAVHTLRHWLDERYPAANQPAPARPGRKQVLEAPHWNREIRPLLDRFDAEVERVQPQLVALIERHRRYVRESGDCSSLVPAFHQLARFLAAGNHIDASKLRDPDLALELALEAANWAPGDPRSWSAVAEALATKGDWPRAQATYWYARRRFPYNAHSHAQLGHALVLQGQLDAGEAVHRGAIRRFPENAVCWSDLAHTLRVAGRHEESLAVYRQAQQRFHRYPAICSGLTGVLIDLGRLGEARDALQWAEQVVGEGARDQEVVTRLRLRFEALVAGRPLPWQVFPSRPPEVQSGDWQALAQCAGIDLRGSDALGLSTLWRQRGNAADAERARTALDAAAGLLRQGRDDARWLAEQGWWLLAFQGPEAAQSFLDQAIVQRPGDGVLAVLGLRAHGAAGDAADWATMFTRHPELTPLLRLAQDPRATPPADLKAALASVTSAGGVLHADELDEDLRQAQWVYDTATQPEVAELGQQDYLASRQLVAG
jgi:tetratricopeptide (TPR) repeat protein